MANQPKTPGATSQVWPSDVHPGFRRSIDVAGTVAAPLLAGFSFLLLVLLLPALADKTTKVVTNGNTRLIEHAPPFSAFPELATILLLLAALLLIATVQAAVTARYHSHTPTDLAEWYPEYFPEGTGPFGKGPDGSDLPEWHTAEWPAMQVGSRWYGGWARSFLHTEQFSANKWASAARTTYHLGIMSLLLGVLALVIPPSGQGTPWRVALAGVAAAGVVVEGGWIARVIYDDLTAARANRPARDTSSTPAHEHSYAVKTWRYLRLAMILLTAGLAWSLLFERSKTNCFQPSLSAYYYTPARNYFVGAIVGIAVCLLCLRGNGPVEDVLLNLAGMLAPVVALVPTPERGSCTSTPVEIHQPQGANIANNATTLLAIGLVGVVVAVVLTERAGRSRSGRVGYTMAIALEVVAGLVFLLDRHAFDHAAHYAAAIPMFICITLVVLSNAIGYEGTPRVKALRNRYGAVATGMVVSSAACGIAGIAGWGSWLITLETALLVFFAIFWSVQTHELWRHGLRPSRP